MGIRKLCCVTTTRTIFNSLLTAHNEREVDFIDTCFYQKTKIDKMVKTKDRSVYDELLRLEAQVEALIDLEMLCDTSPECFRRCFVEYSQAVLRHAASWKK